MLSNVGLISLLVSAGSGTHPYGESIALLFIGIAIAILVVLGLIFVLVEPFLFLIRKKGKKVILISAFLNGIALLIAILFLLILSNSFLLNMFIYLVILLIQLVKYIWIKGVNLESENISKVYTIIALLLYFILVVI